MKTPRAVGTPISQARIRRWIEEFARYRYAVTQHSIDRWIDQFEETHRDLAARVLDAVEFVAPEHIDAAFRSTLARLRGWSRDDRKRVGKWRFVPFSVSAGESGDSMLHAFRVANDLDFKKFDSLFVQKRDLLAEGLAANDSVVFVDDFAGTGNQAIRAWQQSIAELLPGSPKTYLLMPVARRAARERIVQETGFRVVAHKELQDGDNIFDDACAHFTRGEKNALLRYCRTASQQIPKGYGDCGLVLVLAHRCPNNSIPVLHASHDAWDGIFPR